MFCSCYTIVLHIILFLNLKEKQQKMNDPIFDLDDIKYKLKFISDASDSDAFYTFLPSIIKPNNAYINKLFLIRNRYKRERADFEKDILAYDYWSPSRNRIDYGLLEILDELEKESLKDDCEAIIEDFINHQNGKTDTSEMDASEQTEVFIFTNDTHDIIIPDTKELTNAEKQQYKRLLIQCQDAIGVQDYASAYQFCDTARKEIEPESAQLYEYLLLTFIKKQSAEKIIREAIKGDKNKFDHVLLYVRRSKKYQHESQKKCLSKTLEPNLKKVAEDFALCLRNEYRGIKSDWVLHTEGVTSSDDRKMIQSIMDIYEKVYMEIHTVQLFLSEIYFEICGAGKFQWIKLGKNNRLYNVTSFDALKKEKSAQRPLKEIFLQDYKRPDKMPENVFSERVYFSLWSKYMELRAKIKGKSRKFGTFNNDSEARQQMIKCFESFKIGYILFQDKRFLEIPLKELSEEGVILWFDLNASGKFINKWQSDNFDALTEWEYYKREKSDIVLLLKKEDALEKKVGRDIAEKTTEEYHKIRYRSHANFSILEKERHTIFTCLERLFVAYRATLQPELIHLIMNEVGGNVMLNWFDSTENGFLSKKWFRNTDNEAFTIDTLLNEIFEWDTTGIIEGYSKQILKEQIAKKFFETLKQRYQSETFNNKSLRNSFNDLEILSNCYDWHSKEEYLDFAINAIWVNQLYYSLTLGDSGNLMPTLDAQQYDFEPYTSIDFFCAKISREGIKEKIIGLLANRFFQDAFQQYIRISSTDSPISRGQVIKFIRTCHHCYLLYPHPEYLKSAINELEGEKFKWITNVPYLGRFNKSRGQVNSFDAIKTLDELQRMLL